jgi:tRNA-Thr(GGU) m(6)t(6)A37 methyltransferase TsaA
MTDRAMHDPAADGEAPGQPAAGTWQRPVTMRPIGVVRRTSADEDDRDSRLVSQVVIREELAPALDGIDEWSHIYVIFWLDRVPRPEKPQLHQPADGPGVLATRAPIHPNPIGLTLVELVRRQANVLWVRGLDAFDGTPVLDIKPYPNWDSTLQVVTEFRVPAWLRQHLQR